MENRRRFVRIPAALRFTLSWPGAFGLYRTVDLSAGGARVVHQVTGSPRPKAGTEGECAFVLDGVELRAMAVVVRERPDGFAVRFRGLTQAQDRRIVAWVIRQQAMALSRRIPA